MTRLLFKRVASVAMLLMAAGCAAGVEIADSPSTPTRESVAAEPTVAPATVVPVDVAGLEPTATPSPAVEPVATVEPTATPVQPSPTPTISPAPAPTLAAIAEHDHSGLAGTRGLTLQWISWDPTDWGMIEFIPLVDGSYVVSGSQVGPDGDYVKVDGSIVRVDESELLFTGEVVVKLEFSNDGEPCVRSGDIRFLATGDRRFWRMQDLLSCDGIITDYVDIYFG